MNLLKLLETYPDIAATVVGLVTMLWRSKKKATSMTDLWETLQDLAMQAFPHLLADPVNAWRTAREEITKAVWSGMTRLGIKRSKAVDVLVNEVVEWALARLAEKITERSFTKLKATLGETDRTLKDALAKPPFESLPEPEAEPESPPPASDGNRFGSL